MRKISLTQGKFALVDDEDYEAVSLFSWYAHTDKKYPHYYAVANAQTIDGKVAPIPRKSDYMSNFRDKKTGRFTKSPIIRINLRMHRYILGAGNGDIVDHINHDTLDNRRYNLRVCKRHQNNSNQRVRRNNTSGYKGVFVRKGSKGTRFYAYINSRGKRYLLGTFDTAIEAAKAYNEAAKIYHGEFAHLNEIE